MYIIKPFDTQNKQYLLDGSASKVDKNTLKGILIESRGGLSTKISKHIIESAIKPLPNIFQDFLDKNHIQISLSNYQTHPNKYYSFFKLNIALVK